MRNNSAFFFRLSYVQLVLFKDTVCQDQVIAILIAVMALLPQG
jgi:hypothetical protein